MVASVPGVTATAQVNHSYAYVGPDLQDTFGVDPSHFRDATSLRDSYFIGGSADQMMNRLASTPDGILVSKETMSDYQLNVGDRKFAGMRVDGIISPGRRIQSGIH